MLGVCDEMHATSSGSSIDGDHQHHDWLACIGTAKLKLTSITGSTAAATRDSGSFGEPKLAARGDPTGRWVQ